MERYNFDYSRWDVWKPTDPVSMAEAEEAEKIEEAAKNEAFEKANPEFCQQHMDDLKERQKAVKKKQESSDISRLKGNRFFKQKDYDTALTYYTDALKVRVVKDVFNLVMIFKIIYLTRYSLGPTIRPTYAHKYRTGEHQERKL